MLDLKTLRRAIDQLAEEKAIDASKIMEAIESSIAAAYKKEYEKKGEIIKAKFDLKTGEMKFWQVKTVADETTVRLEDEETPALTESETEVLTAKHVGKEAPPAPTVPESIENILPRYNPDRHILIEEAKKIKKDAQLGDL